VRDDCVPSGGGIDAKYTEDRCVAFDATGADYWWQTADRADKKKFDVI
jgi:hypothetical protein